MAMTLKLETLEDVRDWHAHLAAIGDMGTGAIIEAIAENNRKAVKIIDAHLSAQAKVRVTDEDVYKILKAAGRDEFYLDSVRKAMEDFVKPVAAPGGWAVQRRPNGTLCLHSPDGNMSKFKSGSESNDHRDEHVCAFLEAMLSEPASANIEYPECSGNPLDCPENEGYGCCKIAAPQPPEGARVVGDEMLYRQACNAVEEWKKRAIEAESIIERMRLETSPSFMGEPAICTHEWETVSTKGGMMDRCKKCEKHRWHKPIPHATDCNHEPDCNLNMADYRQRMKGCDCGAAPTLDGKEG